MSRPGQLLVLALALVTAGCQLDPGPAGSAVRAQSRYNRATWSVCAVELTTGDTLVEFDADRLLAPASTAKLFSVAAGFEGLGANHRFETTVHRLGTLAPDGRLRGALILRASGDLILGGRDLGDGRLATSSSDHIYARANPRTEWTSPSPVRGLDLLAQQIYDAGVRVVDDVWIDARAFPPFPSSGSGPEQVWPIAINDNLIDFEIRPARPTEPAVVRPRPASAHVQVTSRVRTVRGGTYAVEIRSPAPGRFELVGTIPLNHPTQREAIPVRNPPAWARLLWIEALSRHGVLVDGPKRWHNPTELLPPRGTEALPVVARLSSAPFSEQARLILKVSHNLHASAIPMLLGLARGHRDLRRGMEACATGLKTLGVNPAEVSLAGGAGGHDADRTSARATVKLLQAVATRPYYRAFRRALPILGVDGTLTHIGTHSPARGKIAAKTGSLYTFDALNRRRILTAKTLAGYLTARSGREVVFAVMVNNVLFDAETTLESVSEDLAEVATALFETL